MATVTRELRYMCADDCQMSGCPGHDGRLDYQSVSDSYTFTMNGRELFFERGELDAMIDLLVNVDRADSANAEALSTAELSAKIANGELAIGGGNPEYVKGVPDDAWAQAYKEIAATPLSEIQGDLYQAVKSRAAEIREGAPFDGNKVYQLRMPKHPNPQWFEVVRAEFDKFKYFKGYESRVLYTDSVPTSEVKAAAYIIHDPDAISRMVLTADGMALGYGTHAVFTHPATPTVDEAWHALRTVAKKINRYGLDDSASDELEAALAALSQTDG